MKAVLRDSRRSSTLLLFVVISLLCAGSVAAQTSTPATNRTITFPPRAPGEPGERPLSNLEEELNAKRAIKLAEKEHEENLDRAREIGQIGKELRECVKAKLSIDREFLKKIERLEKLTKKVRGEAGGEDEEVKIDNRPSDVKSAVSQIAEVSQSFSKDVQNTPRQVVSAAVISTSNVLLELIKIFRTFTR